MKLKQAYHKRIKGCCPRCGKPKDLDRLPSGREPSYCRSCSNAYARAKRHKSREDSTFHFRRKIQAAYDLVTRRNGVILSDICFVCGSTDRVSRSDPFIVIPLCIKCHRIATPD